MLFIEQGGHWGKKKKLVITECTANNGPFPAFSKTDEQQNTGRLVSGQDVHGATNSYIPFEV